MRNRFSDFVERARVRAGEFGSNPGDTFGVFMLKHPRSSRRFKVVVGDIDWDHVSVSRPSGGLPTWDDMCWIKRVFFRDDECVVQYHPPAKDYIDHGQVLHLWRQQGAVFPMPPKICV